MTSVRVLTRADNNKQDRQDRYHHNHRVGIIISININEIKHHTNNNNNDNMMTNNNNDATTTPTTDINTDMTTRVDMISDRIEVMRSISLGPMLSSRVSINICTLT